MLKVIIIISSLLIISCKPDPNKLIGKWAIDSKGTFPDTLKIIKYKNELITSTNYDVQTLRYNSENKMMTIYSSYQVGCIVSDINYHIRYVSSLDKLYIETEVKGNEKKLLIKSALYSKISD